MHRELDRVKQSYFDKQHGFTRTYAEKLSILTNMLILVWILGLTTFYMSLALVYGRFKRQRDKSVNIKLQSF